MGLLNWFFNQADSRPKTGWATMPSEPEAADGAVGSEAGACTDHEWEEVGREGRGWDGGGYHDGRGEYWYTVTYRCRKCGATKEEDTT